MSQYAIQPLSLNPRKTLATSFAKLGNAIVKNTADITLISSITDTLELYIPQNDT
ncbi:hypothetical protein [Scytonema sp. NUACC21]